MNDGKFIRRKISNPADVNELADKAARIESLNNSMCKKGTTQCFTEIELSAVQLWNVACNTWGIHDTLLFAQMLTELINAQNSIAAQSIVTVLNRNTVKIKSPK